MNPDGLHAYVYQHLDESKNDICLATRRLGNHDNPLKIMLQHVSFNLLPPQPPPSTLSLSQFQDTLPRGWSVCQTTEGRILFESPDKTTTWVRPSPHVSPTAYDITLPTARDIVDTPDFEALSYTWGSFSRTATVVVFSGLIFITDRKPFVLQIGDSLSEAL